MATFKEHLHLPVTCVTRADVMLAKLDGVSDPERKRKIIGADFIEAFTEEAQRLEKTLGGKPAFLVQVCVATWTWKTCWSVRGQSTTVRIIHVSCSQAGRIVTQMFGLVHLVHCCMRLRHEVSRLFWAGE